MIYVMALNPERRILFTWKCDSRGESRVVLGNLYRTFANSLTGLTVAPAFNMPGVFPENSYDSRVTFNYKTHPDYYTPFEYRIMRILGDR